eukprot:jgi/Chrzof1/13723/Cz08g09170.t1
MMYFLHSPAAPLSVHVHECIFLTHNTLPMPPRPPPPPKKAITASYLDHERLVWEQLSGLVRDAAWLESYIAATMLIVKEAAQGVAIALGPSKQPLPAYRDRRDRARVEYGGVADNIDVIAELAPVSRCHC